MNVAHYPREPVPAHGSQSALGMSGQYNAVRRKERRRAVYLPCLVTPVPYRIEKDKPNPSADLIRVANPANLSWLRQAGLGPAARPFRWIDITEIVVDRARPRLTDF